MRGSTGKGVPQWSVAGQVVGAIIRSIHSNRRVGESVHQDDGLVVPWLPRPLYGGADKRQASDSSSEVGIRPKLLSGVRQLLVAALRTRSVYSTDP
jgi:hypothetical protein